MVTTCAVGRDHSMVVEKDVAAGSPCGKPSPRNPNVLCLDSESYPNPAEGSCLCTDAAHVLGIEYQAAGARQDESGQPRALWKEVRCIFKAVCSRDAPRLQAPVCGRWRPTFPLCA